MFFCILSSVIKKNLSSKKTMNEEKTKEDDEQEWTHVCALLTTSRNNNNTGSGSSRGNHSEKIALDLLRMTLIRLYGRPSITMLCESRINMDLLERMTENLNLALDELKRARGWQQSTVRGVLCALRGVLRKTRVAPAVIRAIRGANLSSKRASLMGKKIDALALDDPLRKNVTAWEELLRRNTNYRSDTSLINIMTFFLLRVVPALEINLSATYPVIVDVEKVRGLCEDETRLRALLQADTQNTMPARRLFWFKVFIEHIVAPPVPISISNQMVRRIIRRQKHGSSDSDGHDVHRIPKAYLERLYVVAQDSVLDELMFLTLLSTGMRVGAFRKMKCTQVADIVSGKWVAREVGRVLEKNAKLVSFNMTERVRHLLSLWLNKHRPTYSGSVCEYVFPGRSGVSHASYFSFRVRFASMCRRAGVREARCCHLHALRHTYAHIMSELGNSTEVISKLLNHNNASTTQQYYLRESAAEISNRANIPWLRDSNYKVPEDPVPDFLKSSAVAPAKRLKHSNTIADAKSLMARLNHINVPVAVGVTLPPSSLSVPLSPT